MDGILVQVAFKVVGIAMAIILWECFGRDFISWEGFGTPFRRKNRKNYSKEGE